MKPTFLTRSGLVLGLALLIPATALAQVVVEQPPPAPPPPPTTVIVPPAQESVTEVDTGPNMLLVTGLVSFGISYGSSVIVASQSNHQGDDRLYVPVLGPWLDISDRGNCDVSNSKCDGETTNKVLLVIDGVVQGAGLLAVVGGILAPGTQTTRTTSVAQKGIHFTPVSYGPASPGLAAFGSF